MGFWYQYQKPMGLQRDLNLRSPWKAVFVSEAINARPIRPPHLQIAYVYINSNHFIIDRNGHFANTNKRNGQRPLSVVRSFIVCVSTVTQKRYNIMYGIEIFLCMHFFKSSYDIFSKNRRVHFPSYVSVVNVSNFRNTGKCYQREYHRVCLSSETYVDTSWNRSSSNEKYSSCLEDTN